MDSYEINGKNIIINNKKNNETEYYYKIKFKKEKNKIYLEILDYRTTLWFLPIMKINILNMAQKMTLIYDEKKGIIGVENYNELKELIKLNLMLYEIKYPDLLEFIKYLDEKIQKENNFVDMIKEVDFINFLFDSNEEKIKIYDFFGVDINKNVEIERIKKRQNNVEQYNYEMTKEVINKLKINYILYSEEVPNYYLEGKGEKIYEDEKLLKAKLYIKSGKNEEFKREISINIKQILE